MPVMYGNQARRFVPAHALGMRLSMLTQPRPYGDRVLYPPR